MRHTIVMYKVSVAVDDSPIDGKGVFTRKDIAKDTVVWQFNDKHDIVFTPAEYEAVPPEYKARLKNTGYLSPWSNNWVFPPKDDPAQYTNHSAHNNLSARFDAEVSPEPYFVANRDIVAGEELTNNYHEFDQITRTTKPQWAVKATS